MKKILQKTNERCAEEDEIAFDNFVWDDLKRAFTLAQNTTKGHTFLLSHIPSSGL